MLTTTTVWDVKIATEATIASPSRHKGARGEPGQRRYFPSPWALLPRGRTNGPVKKIRGLATVSATLAFAIALVGQSISRIVNFLSRLGVPTLPTSTAPVRIGVVGIGYGQQVLVPAFRSDPRCEVTGIAASTDDRAAKAAHQIGVPHSFGDWRALIDSPHVDAVAISVPPTLQPEIVSAALMNGKAVFCEKPLGVSMAAVATLAEAAAKANLPNLVDFLFPEIPTWIKTKKMLDSGALGSLRHVDLHWSVETYANKMGLESWKTRPDDGGGALSNFFSHSFYYLEWLLGPITRLSATLIRAPGDDRPGETIVAMTLDFRSGILATATLNTAAPLTHTHRLMFHGDEGTMMLENATADYVTGFRLSHGIRSSEALQPIEIPGNFADSVDGRILASAKLGSRWLDWIQSGVPANPTIQDGLRVQSLLEAARKSHQSGTWIDT
jgi:predicted dehydrogenase